MAGVLERGGAMHEREAAVEGGLTRRRALGVAVAGALAGGGAAFVTRGGAGSVGAATSHQLDTRIIDYYLTLERVQLAFYDAAVKARKLDGEPLELALAVRDQEQRHVAFLQDWLKGAAGPPPHTTFDEAVTSAGGFLQAAIDLEEAAIAGYIGQSAHLGEDTMRTIATLLSVEARQVAWLRDLAGVSPAPRAADLPRAPGDVMAFLRDKGYVA
jgi:rubrerythrin